MSLLEVYHICISNSTLYTSYNLYFSANSQRKHQVQTRHFDRKSAQNATSFRLAVDTVLLGVLACFSSAFLAVRSSQPERESTFFYFKFFVADFGVIVRQLADGGVLAAVFCQPVFQICVVGADMDCRFFFVKPNIRGLFLFCQSCFHRNSFFALFGQEGHFSGIFLGS